ncbi:MAG: hypothetical protein EOO50_06645 [Flavobacterium sp.]|uniref:hypothetical protein n=1 Tax=Flavobacterium sp. TaxID=239 RepID=UPI001218AADD|nr:hypothetical protein [Flavobacterium sp.]RZJ67196.1 MAG: hypothetical protein EOO50_06645 [Flavobacterium sp.]
MRNFTKLGMIALAFGLFSCSGDDAGNPASGTCDTDALWLQSGKFVEYDLEQFGFVAGTMKLSFGDCNGNGFVTTRQMIQPDGTVASTTTDLVFQDAGFIKNDVGSNGGYASTLYKLNASLGDVWSETNDNGSVITHEVVDIDSTITVPAGTFNCKVYKYTSSTAVNESFIFWNDEVGEVMEDAGFFTLKLKEHNYN